MQIAATILAGGNASRLHGFPKGNIKIAKNLTIIGNILNELEKTEINHTLISSNEPSRHTQYNRTILQDDLKISGPLTGIVTTLKYFTKTHDAVLFCPCDLPNITSKELQILLNTFHQNRKKIVYAKTKYRNHPLCAVIPITQLANIIDCLNNGINKITSVWNQLPSIAVEFPDDQIFLNINSGKDIRSLGIQIAIVWIISGAGRKVGKTTVSTKLCEILQKSIYAKFGHGKFKPNKTENFFQNEKNLREFIIDNMFNHKHIVIESNTLSLSHKGDIRIFIDGVQNKTYFRKDSTSLKQAAHIIIDKNFKTCEQVLQKLIPKKPASLINTILKQQKIYLFGR